MFDALISLCSLLQTNNDLPPPPNKHPHISTTQFNLPPECMIKVMWLVVGAPPCTSRGSSQVEHNAQACSRFPYGKETPKQVVGWTG